MLSSTRSTSISQLFAAIKSYFKISNEVFIDALAAKNVTDQIYGETSSKLNGYIQEISLDPFGFLLISQIQVN